MTSEIPRRYWAGMHNFHPGLAGEPHDRNNMTSRVRILSSPVPQHNSGLLNELARPVADRDFHVRRTSGTQKIVRE